MKVAIGIDIGGTNVQIAMVDRPGKILQKIQLSVADLTTGQLFFKALKNTIEGLLAHSSELDLDGIGLGSPGANIKEGTIENASNLPWNGLPIVNFLRHQFEVPVYLTNDANLFAIGEKVFGAASDLNDFAVITMGTGVGAGFYSGGALLLGKDGLAGELGHVVIVRNGRPCLCGRRGCLEQYTSANGLLITANKMLKNQQPPTSLLNQLPGEKMCASQVVEAARQGDLVAIEAFRYTGKILGWALSDLVAYLNPEAIFLAGGLSRAGQLLFEPTIRTFKENLLSIYPSDIPILSGSVPDDQAGVLGAAALVWDTVGQLNKLQSSLN